MQETHQLTFRSDTSSYKAIAWILGYKAHFFFEGPVGIPDISHIQLQVKIYLRNVMHFLNVLKTSVSSVYIYMLCIIYIYIHTYISCVYMCEYVLIILLLFACMCSSVHTCSDSESLGAHICMWRSEISLGYHFSGALHLLLFVFFFVCLLVCFKTSLTV